VMMPQMLQACIMKDTSSPRTGHPPKKKTQMVRMGVRLCLLHGGPKTATPMYQTQTKSLPKKDCEMIHARLVRPNLLLLLLLFHTHPPFSPSTQPQALHPPTPVAPPPLAKPHSRHIHLSALCAWYRGLLWDKAVRCPSPSTNLPLNTIPPPRASIRLYPPPPPLSPPPSSPPPSTPPLPPLTHNLGRNSTLNTPHAHTVACSGTMLQAARSPLHTLHSTLPPLPPLPIQHPPPTPSLAPHPTTTTQPPKSTHLRAL
jgi:hypothetical protein